MSQIAFDINSVIQVCLSLHPHSVSPEKPPSETHGWAVDDEPAAITATRAAASMPRDRFGTVRPVRNRSEQLEASYEMQTSICSMLTTDDIHRWLPNAFGRAIVRLAATPLPGLGRPQPNVRGINVHLYPKATLRLISSA